MVILSESSYLSRHCFQPFECLFDVFHLLRCDPDFFPFLSLAFKYFLSGIATIDNMVKRQGYSTRSGLVILIYPRPFTSGSFSYQIRAG